MSNPLMFAIDLSEINDFQLESLRRSIKRSKAAHFTDLIIRINGQDERIEADWLKHFVEMSEEDKAKADLVTYGTVVIAIKDGEASHIPFTDIYKGKAEMSDTLQAVIDALPEFRRQDDYLLAHGASLMSEDSHEIIHIDTMNRIVAASTERLERECAELRKKLEDVGARCVELHHAVVWALGAGEIFRPQGEREGKYWWRNELADRARLVWSEDGYRYVQKEPPL